MNLTLDSLAMAFEIVLRSAAPPDRVLTAIRESLREWRESAIPRDVRDQGVLQVVGEVAPPGFRMRVDRRWDRGDGLDPLTLTGEVSSDGNGGSRVRARCGRRSLYPSLGVVGFGAFLVWEIYANRGMPWGLLVVGGIALAIGAMRDGAVSVDDRAAAYLAKRLEEAVTSATASIPKPAV